jgi:hypothetical protein
MGTKTEQPWSPWGEELGKQAYVQVPHVIFRILTKLGLTHGESVLAIVLVGFARPDTRYVSISRERLCIESCLGLQTVLRAMKKLKDLGVETVLAPSVRTCQVGTYDLRKFLTLLGETRDDIPV